MAIPYVLCFYFACALNELNIKQVCFYRPVYKLVRACEKKNSNKFVGKFKMRLHAFILEI